MEPASCYVATAVPLEAHDATSHQLEPPTQSASPPGSLQPSEPSTHLRTGKTHNVRVQCHI